MYGVIWVQGLSGYNQQLCLSLNMKPLTLPKNRACLYALEGFGLLGCQLEQRFFRILENIAKNLMCSYSTSMIDAPSGCTRCKAHARKVKCLR